MGDPRNDRYGTGLAMPVQMGSDGLNTVSGLDLLAQAVKMTVSIHRGELRYDPTKGTRLRQMKHTPIQGAQQAPLATHLIGEVIAREEPRVRMGRCLAEFDGAELRILVPWTERGYDGTGAPQVTELEV